MPLGQFPELIGQLYEAAADDQLWSGMAGRIAAAFNSTSTVVKLHGGRGGFQLLESTGNLAVPESLQSWAEHWHRHDLWVERSISVGINRIVTSDDLVTPEEQMRSGFYQEWLAGLDIHHMVGAVFPCGNGAVGVIGIHRPPGTGGYTETDRQRVALLLPHLQRALQLGQRLAEAGLAQAITQAALDRLDTGVLAVDGHGRLLHANAEAEEILRAGGELQLLNGRLTARHPALRDRLAAMMRGVMETAEGRPSRAPVALAIPRGDRLPLTLALAPLRPTPFSRFVEARPCVLVFLRDPERRSPRVDHLRDLFGLTPTEAAIAADLAVGRSLEAIAGKHHIGIGTVRWHLKSILSKTGTARQTEAAALLARSVAVLPR
ncbi:helix-turn-helix transcriptional regulator [Acetobacteraceae bacterium H6797]|nr:helix-turn-helix transcriptional regulator [Acetobacteraceae bacterium H6797]